MPELLINFIKKENCVIVAVGIGNITYPVQIVVDWLNESPENSCYTLKGGKKVKVEARFSETGKWYLTTDPDDTRLNNLDFLPQCLEKSE